MMDAVMVLFQAVSLMSVSPSITSMVPSSIDSAKLYCDPSRYIWPQ